MITGMIYYKILLVQSVAPREFENYMVDVLMTYYTRLSIKSSILFVICLTRWKSIYLTTESHLKSKRNKNELHIFFIIFWNNDTSIRFLLDPSL
ncbi:unnamed protein product [Rhizophagus irregularis]|nr:unnamed protein product [Rhizophagus irregularis]